MRFSIFPTAAAALVLAGFAVPALAQGSASEAKPRNEEVWAQQIQANYPFGALRAMVEGTVGVRVDIAPTGNIMRCRVTASSGSAILDNGACEAMVRFAQFEPARDANGDPTDGTYATRITYKMNSRPPEGFPRGAATREERIWARLIQMNYPTQALRYELQGTVGVRTEVDERGLVSRCFVIATSGHDVLDTAACQGMLRYAMFHPALDTNGDPTKSRYATRITYRINNTDLAPPVRLEGEGREVTLEQ